MIKEIQLSNFKVFKGEMKFPLSKINLLTGINGRGKSTLLQSVLLMRQSTENNEYGNKLILNGDYVDLGGFLDVKNKENPIQNNININFEIEQDKDISFSLRYSFKGDIEKKWLELDIFEIYFPEKLHTFAGSYSNNILIENSKDGNTSEIKLKGFLPQNFSQFTGDLPLKNISFSFEQIHYVSADRLGPQKFYESYNSGNFINTGKRGEYVGNVLSEKKSKIIYQKLQLGNNTNTLQDQVGDWLSKILDTPNISVKIDDTTNDYFIVLSFIINGKEFKPSNVGFGYTYILPIIVSGLIAEKNHILIVENPEAHLHPKAQSELAKFLAKVASEGVQVFIESHSDHILNGLRVAVKKEEIQPEDISILYFQEKNHQTEIIFPKIDKDGRIDEWPEGFFDEWDNNLMLLL
jgi:predicted ATPase